MIAQQGFEDRDLPPSGEGPAIPELKALASILQQGRQAQGLSLADLSRRLHMGLEQLEALEAGESARLREPVFVIAQARRVAECLGLEIGPQIEALRRSEAFNASVPSLKSEAFKPTPKPLPKPANPASRSSLPWLLPLLVLAAAVAAAVAVLVPRQRLVAVNAPALPARPAKPVMPAKRATPVPPLQTIKPQPAPSELVLVAPQTSWLEVRSLAGGQPLFRGMLKGEKRFPLSPGIKLLAGRPDVVTVAIGTATPRPLGTIKDIRWFTFTGQPQAKRLAPPQPSP